MLTNSEISQAPARLPVMALFAANAVSQIGTVMTQLAIPWFVLQTTGSAAKTGLVAFFIILPTVFAAFLGGPLVDRFGFRRSSVLADLACTVTIALIPLLYSAGFLEFWLLLALVFVANLFDTPGITARTAMAPELAVMANMTIEQVSSAMQVINRSSRLVGAPLAGLLIAVLGASQVLWLDAATFAISAVLIALLVPRAEKKPVSEDGEPGEPFVAQILGGFKFIWNDRLIRVIVGAVMVTNLLDGAIYGVVLPFYTKTFFGEALDLGLLLAAGGGGAVVGAVIFGAFSKRLPQRKIFIWGFTAISLQYFMMSFLPPYWVLLIAFAFSGLASGPLNPIIFAVIYNRIPASDRGKVIGALTAGVNIVTPFGILATGFLLEQIDVRLVLAVIAFVYLAVTSSMFLSRAVRQIGQKD